MGNYIETADVNNWPDGITDTEKEGRVDRAERQIEDVLGKVFYEESFVELFSGNGTNFLDLGFQDPVLEVTKVERVAVDGTASEVDTSSWDYDSRRVYGYEFPEGYNNIRVTGTHGEIPTPKGIETATIHLVQYYNDETAYTTYTQGSRREGSLSRDVKKRPLTGVEEVDMILRDFDNHRAVPRAV